MREFKRKDRLADQIKREIAQILSRTIKHPKIGFVTVTGVELSSDLKYAKVYYSTLGTAIDKAESGRVLERTKGVVQAELGKRLRIRQTPIITYKVDRSLEYGDRIDSLLDQIKQESGQEDEATDD